MCGFFFYSDLTFSVVCLFVVVFFFKYLQVCGARNIHILSILKLILICWKLQKGFDKTNVYISMYTHTITECVLRLSLFFSPQLTKCKLFPAVNDFRSLLSCFQTKTLNPCTDCPTSRAAQQCHRCLEIMEVGGGPESLLGNREAFGRVFS